MPDDTTNTPKLEVTWTPATCEGLPPVGSKIAVPGNNDGKYYWRNAVLGEYQAPDSPYRPAHIHGDIPYVYVGFPGHFMGWYYLLSDCVLLGIEKQPRGWPDHVEDRNKPDLDILRSQYNMREDAFADLLTAWLKDNGYLKR